MYEDSSENNASHLFPQKLKHNNIHNNIIWLTSFQI